MKNSTATALKITGFVLGTFTVAVLANITADKILHENKPERIKGIAAGVGGVLATGLMVALYHVKPDKI